jgi:hypothetical protein
MSRFIRTAGDSVGRYTDGEVCQVISGGVPCISSCSISSSNGYGICDLRSGWERIYYETCLKCIGSNVEFIVDSTKYDSFCLSFRNMSWILKGNTSCCYFLKTGVAYNGNYLCCYCCSQKSIGIDKSCPSNNGAYGCTRCCPGCSITGERGSNELGFDYGITFTATYCGILAQDNFWTSGYTCNCRPNTGLCSLVYLNWGWCGFSKFKVSGDIMTGREKGTIELLGKKISPSIGVEE